MGAYGAGVWPAGCQHQGHACCGWAGSEEAFPTSMGAPCYPRGFLRYEFHRRQAWLEKARQQVAKQEWLPTFDSFGKGTKIPSVNIIAVFVNDFNDKSLRLKQYLELDFEADETVKSAKGFFLNGDVSADSDFRGLSNHDYLSQYEWSLELWVLPQLEGCTTLIKWDDIPQLKLGTSAIEGLCRKMTVSLKQ